MSEVSRKPLGQKAYGSIPHLPGSRQGPKDIGLSPGQAAIATMQTRDKHDRVVVQEKLDGSCCSIAKLDSGEIVALSRSGFRADTSPYEQHHRFAAWVAGSEAVFAVLLHPGERIVGEWLALAHGTRYRLLHGPFVPFDLMVGTQRLTFPEFYERLAGHFPLPHLLHEGGPCSISDAMERLGEFGHHGALDRAEGAVWRVERYDHKRKRYIVDFLCKYVRHGKIDGCYLPEVSGKDPVWNWTP